MQVQWMNDQTQMQLGEDPSTLRASRNTAKATVSKTAKDTSVNSRRQLRKDCSCSEMDDSSVDEESSHAAPSIRRKRRSSTRNIFVAFTPHKIFSSENGLLSN